MAEDEDRLIETSDQNSSKDYNAYNSLALYHMERARSLENPQEKDLECDSALLSMNEFLRGFSSIPAESLGEELKKAGKNFLSVYGIKRKLKKLNDGDLEILVNAIVCSELSSELRDRDSSIHRTIYQEYSYLLSVAKNTKDKDVQELIDKIKEARDKFVDYGRGLTRIVESTNNSREELQLSIFEQISESLAKGYWKETFERAFLLGNLYSDFGGFILDSKERIGDFSLKYRVYELAASLEVNISGDNLSELAKSAFQKAKESYEYSRSLKNQNRINDSKLGSACYNLARLSNDDTERFKNYLDALMNFELSRKNENEEIQNDEYIANCYQELGHLVSRLDLILDSSEAKGIEEFIEKRGRETAGRCKFYDILRELKSKGDKKDRRFDRKTTRDVAIRLLEKANSDYNNIRDKKEQTRGGITRQDYSYRGKCKVRLGKLQNDCLGVEGGINDLEQAIRLKDPSPQICSLLGEAYLALAHMQDFLRRREYFFKALEYLKKSEERDNKGKEFYGLFAECYRHLLKSEFRDENPNPERVQEYLDGTLKYAVKAGGKI